MNGTSHCVKVTFSVVGTRTLEYTINENKEYREIATLVKEMSN